MPTDIGVGVLDKVAAILDAIEAGAAHVEDVRRYTGYSRATCYRLISALQVHNMVERDPQDRLRLGRRVRPQNHAADMLAMVAQPFLDRVRDATGESAQLYQRLGDWRVCLAIAEREHGLRDTVPVGAEFPMTAGSGAQVLLAWEPIGACAAVLAKAQFTERTLREVRRVGWAQTSGEREPGVSSVSAPVRSGDGRVVAALSVSGPASRLRAERIAPCVLMFARDLSQRLSS